MQASHFLTRTLTSKDSLQNGVAWMLKIDNHQIATAYTLPNNSKYEKTKLKHVKSYPTKKRHVTFPVWIMRRKEGKKNFNFLVLHCYGKLKERGKCNCLNL